MNETLKKLSEKLSQDGIQKADKTKTHKGYNTTGYGYQWVVDRFNDVYGFDWGFDWNIIEKREGTYSTGTPFIDITVDVSIWIKEGELKTDRHCVGGHTAINFSDALKGAITNGLKKTAAFYGVGADAFRGELDDDFSVPEEPQNKENKVKNPKLDFNEITVSLGNMSYDSCVDYKQELERDFPEMTEKQKDAFNKIFNRAFQAKKGESQ